MRSHILGLSNFLLCLAVIAAFSCGCSERRSESQKPASAPVAATDTADKSNTAKANRDNDNDIVAEPERAVAANKHETSSANESVNGKAQRLVNQLYNYCLGICNNDECPADLDAAKAAVKETYKFKWPSDPWDKPYQYKKLSDSKCEVWSSGPDGEDGTDDDIRVDAKNK